MFILKEKDKKMLETLKKFATVSDALPTLGMSARAVYNRLYRLRLKQIEARQFVNQLLAYRRSSSLLRKRLTPRVQLKNEEEL